MERYLGALLILGLIFFAKDLWPSNPVIIESQEPSQVLSASQPIVTESRFTSKLEEQTETILKKTVYQDNPDTETGVDKILEEGEDGKKVKIIKITFLKEKNMSGKLYP